MQSYSLQTTVKVSSSFTDAAMARIAQGTKVLTEGGHDKVFQQTFGTLPGEKLVKAYVCYLSTSSGPVIGTLYISTRRLAFCSDYPYCYYSPTGQQQWMYYKVFTFYLFLIGEVSNQYCNYRLAESAFQYLDYLDLWFFNNTNICMLKLKSIDLAWKKNILRLY